MRVLFLNSTGPVSFKLLLVPLRSLPDILAPRRWLCAWLPWRAQRFKKTHHVKRAFQYGPRHPRCEWGHRSYLRETFVSDWMVRRISGALPESRSHSSYGNQTSLKCPTMSIVNGFADVAIGFRRLMDQILKMIPRHQMTERVRANVATQSHCWWCTGSLIGAIILQRLSSLPFRPFHLLPVWVRKIPGWLLRGPLCAGTKGLLSLRVAECLVSGMRSFWWRREEELSFRTWIGDYAGFLE